MAKNKPAFEIHCQYQGLLPLEELKEHPRNPNKHKSSQVQRLAEIYKYQGIRHPIILSKRTGLIVAGHGRKLAAKKAGMDSFPVVYQNFKDEEQEYAFLVSDNALSDWSELDLASINVDVVDLGPDFDLKMLGIENFALDVSEKGINGEQKANLSEKFGAPPFTILDTRQGYWRDRKQNWLAQGIKSEMGRGENLLGMSDTILKQGKKGAAKAFNIQGYEGGNAFQGSGTSIFDPVLCELMYRWFSPKGGTIVDCFAGGSVRGIVASKLDRQYIGMDLRAEQVEANRTQADEICQDPMPVWHCGDSRTIKKTLKGVEADMVFSCPPYFDLEIYSEDPNDLSNMPWPDFLKFYRQIIADSCSLLKEDSFAAFVVGEVRDKKGIYRDFCGETVQAFIDAGLQYYNEAILVNSFGTAALRANRMFGSMRKLVKCHQNVFIFVKGDPRKATEKIGEVQIDASLVADDADGGVGASE